MNTVSDEQLIRSVAGGDTSCLAALFERHHRDVYRYFLQQLKDRAVSEDLVQDLFLTLLKKAGSFRGEGSFRGWMFNIARNTAHDHRRRMKHRTGAALHETDDDALAGHCSAEQSAAGSQKAQRVLRALARLPVAAQEVIWLGRFEFDNYEELGQALDCSAGAARVRMHRALRELNATYMEMHGVPVDG